MKPYYAGVQRNGEATVNLRQELIILQTTSPKTPAWPKNFKRTAPPQRHVRRGTNLNVLPSCDVVHGWSSGPLCEARSPPQIQTKQATGLYIVLPNNQNVQVRSAFQWEASFLFRVTSTFSRNPAIIRKAGPNVYHNNIQYPLFLPIRANTEYQSDNSGKKKTLVVMQLCVCSCCSN